MNGQAYKSAYLLAELRSATDTNSVEKCEICQLHNRIVCVHSTDAQYASLKAKKRTVATEHASGNKLRVFECGHVYDNLNSVRRSTPGPKEKTKGFCDECWRYLASDGRRMRAGRDRSRRRVNNSYKPKVDTIRRRLNSSFQSTVDTTPRQRLRGKFKVWKVRGLMIGTVQV
ncbi:hypothetical protein F4680DRAFT_261526 [Xylaria scruposa]|nr:hypothetical protein F4680DRAFT_261526 [Xylaria scruposa]